MHHVGDEKVREVFWYERPKLAYLNFGEPQNLALSLGTRIIFVCAWNSAAGMNHELDWGTCGAARGHRDWGCKDSRFSWRVGPHGGSLLSPAGSPNKALPPQFTSPNEKVVYELEAGKVQHSQPASGTGRPSQALPFHCIPGAFPHRAYKLHGLPGRQCGMPVLDARIGEHSFKSWFFCKHN